MDFLIYICLIIIIGVFFFIQNFSEGYNSMIIVLVLSLFGLLMLFNTPPEVITGTNITFIKDVSGSTTGAISQYTTKPFTVFSFGTTNFFAIMYIAFLLLSITNIYFNKIDDMDIRK